MTKKSVIALSVIVILILTASILFGVVFCLQNQTVKVVDSSVISVDASEIIKTANIKNRTSIFMIDKQKAINNIESKYPHIKVVQIKTTNLTSIEICVRSRHEMYYTEANEKYYILDEELKVLEIIDEISSQSEPIHLTKISSGEIEIKPLTKVCDFIGTSQQRKITYNLFVAMHNVVTKIEDENEIYLNRGDICEMNRVIEFEDFESFNKLIITTKHGVKLDIERPQDNLQNKINVCFSTIEQFILEENNKEQSGTIRIYYDLNNEMKCIYIPQSNNE